jgi:hypothetical protein
VIDLITPSRQRQLYRPDRHEHDRRVCRANGLANCSIAEQTFELPRRLYAVVRRRQDRCSIEWD